MTNSNEKRNRVITFIVAVGLGIVLFVLLVTDINSSVDKSVATYSDNQNVLAAVMIKSAASQAQYDGTYLDDNMIMYIKEEFPTSSSMYCVVAKNDEIVFLKDENTSSTISNENLSSFFDENNISTKDNQEYIIASSEMSFLGDQYTLKICTKHSYLMKKIKLGEMKLHCLGYFSIYGVTLLVIILFSYYKLRSKEKKIGILDEEVKNDRLLIEKLENDKNNNYVNSERAGEYSFYNRSVLDEVILIMNEEEKMKCIQVDIFVENLKIEHFVMVTAILGKIKVGGSISAYWGDNQFKVILFNSDNEEVEGFIDLFVSKYKKETVEKVEEIKIAASRLSMQIEGDVKI